MGVPQARAQHDIPQEISHGLMQGMSLQQSYLNASNQLAGYVHMIAAMQAQNGQRQAQFEARVQGIGAQLRGNRGGGMPALQPAVRPW